MNQLPTFHATGHLGEPHAAAVGEVERVEGVEVVLHGVLRPGPVPGEAGVGELAVGEVARLDARVAEHHQREPHLVGHARGDHPQRQPRDVALHGHPHRLHPRNEPRRVGPQPQRDVVHVHRGVEIDHRPELAGHRVPVGAEPVADGHRVGAADHRHGVRTHHLHAQHRHARVGRGGRVQPGAGVGEAPRVGRLRTGRPREGRWQQARRRDVVHVREEAIVGDGDPQRQGVADRQDPAELRRPPAVLELVPQRRLRRRQREHHPVVGHHLHVARRRRRRTEAPTARQRVERPELHRHPQHRAHPPVTSHGHHLPPVATASPVPRWRSRASPVTLPPAATLPAARGTTRHSRRRAPALVYTPR